ncbi:multi-sensor hybrid histidine kinase [Streptomyces sp. OM5714]|nr:multi-sensor hybrid histidine kinase [Streptomyces sp. OM5714]
MFGLITRRRHNAEMAALRSYNDALRERCETAEENERAERVARRTITRQHAELDGANRRLSDRNQALGERISTLTESDPDYLADLEQQLATAREELAAEKRRTERLQAHLDDAVGMPAGGPIADSGPWQPGWKQQKPGAKP